MIEQRYQAKLELLATNPISGRKRRIVPGEVFFAELFQHDPMVSIKLDGSEWLVEREVFKQC
jgi:hypothetical protein